MSDQPESVPTPPVAEPPTNGNGSGKKPVTPESIQRTLYVLTGLTILLYIFVMGTVFLYVIPNQTKTNDALCTFRGDLQTRVIQTQEFLRDHPEGFPGVPAATLQQSLAGQIRTVASLSGLNCPEVTATSPVPPAATPSTTAPTEK